MTVLDHRYDVLPGEPASVGQARRLVAETLRSWRLDELVDDACLLVSELVTNAVLHAGTEVEIGIRRSGRGVRVEVADGSSLVPAPRRYHDEAITGRGLQILDLAASYWGSTPTVTGKVMWFELGTSADDRRAAGADQPTAADDRRITVCWHGLSPGLTKATLEHGDAMLRELALLSFDDNPDHGPMAPIVTPALDLRDLLAALEEAIDAKVPRTDLALAIPAGSPEAALNRLALVDEADRMASDGDLLIPAALPEIVSCRQWLFGQIVAQAAGEAPVRWEMAPAPAAEPEWQTLSEAEIRLLGADLPHSIVADQENRFVFVGLVAAELLGWPPEDLLGRRLTDIIPPDMREAHLVGFTRYQMTGRATLFGIPLALRARRADGRDIDIVVTLGTMPRHQGRLRHRARVDATVAGAS